MASASEPIPHYAYNPSLALAAIAVTLYCLLSVLHSVRMVLTRTWSNIPMVTGGIFLAWGYAARVASAKDIYNDAAFQAYSILALLGPSLLMFTVNSTQADYFSALSAEHLSIIPYRFIKQVYFCGDMISFAIQTTGVTLSAVGTEIHILEIAGKLTTSSFIIQMFWWLFVMIEGIVFQFRLKRHPTAASRDLWPRWKLWGQNFGLATAIIGLGRNMVRMTMLGMGPTGFLSVNEWPTYAFDGYQMAVVMLAWGVFYLPAKCKEVKAKSSMVSSMEDTDTIHLRNRGAV